MPSSSDFPELARLLRANTQWAKDVNAAEPKFFDDCAKGQSPSVLWIGCADSRAPESVVMAARPGEVFVHRNIANQVHPGEPSAESVMYYAIHHLGVRHVVVAGHTKCGGAAACSAAAARSDGLVDPTAGGADAAINSWLAPLTKIAKTLGGDAGLDALVDASVKAQVTNAAASAAVKSAWGKGLKVYVHGWVYHIENGTLRDLKVTIAPPL